MSKLPGVGNKLDNVDFDDRQIDRMASIIKSMTAQEREKPDLINASRKKRIAAGSGSKIEDVNRLLRQFEQMRKMVKQMNGSGVKKKMRHLPGLGGPNRRGF